MTALETLFALGQVRRAWPGKRGAVVFEFFDDEGRLCAGEVRADSSVKRAAFGEDSKLPALAGVLAKNPGARLLVHRLGRRAVLRTDSSFVKVVRSGKAEGIAAASATVAELAPQAGLRAAQVLAADDSTVCFSPVAGSPILAADSEAEIRKGWTALLEALPAFQRLCPPGLGTYDAAAEAATLDAWCEKVQSYGWGSLPSDTLLAAVERVKSQLAATADEHLLLHRDLHDGQLLFDGQSIGVLDLDTAAFGEAALDWGNLLAHLYLRAMQGQISERLAEELAGFTARAALDAGVSLTRLDAYAQAAALRLVFVYRFRPSEAYLLDRWADFALTRAPSLLATA